MTDNFNIDQLGERYANFYTDFEIAKFSTAERRDYEERMKNFRDLYASLETKYNKGHKDGFEKGRAEAEAKAHQDLLTNALEIYKNGMMKIEQISHFLKIDLEELKEFVEKNN